MNPATTLPGLPEGILLIDKPKGITSFDVIRRLRRELGIRKMGHAGTLDPLASGLMILALGPATKLLNAYLKLPKTYEARVMFGRKTSTGDLDPKGEMLEECDMAEKIAADAAVGADGIGDAGAFSEEKIKETLAGMVGTLNLPVPAYSAIKQGGQPLYALARAGKNVEVPVKPMEIRAIRFLGMQEGEGGEGEGSGTGGNGKKTLLLDLEIDVGSGTYIRSLAEEIGRRLGPVPATVADLRRTRIGKFDISQARQI